MSNPLALGLLHHAFIVLYLFVLRWRHIVFDHLIACKEFFEFVLSEFHLFISLCNIMLQLPFLEQQKCRQLLIREVRYCLCWYTLTELRLGVLLSYKLKMLIQQTTLLEIVLIQVENNRLLLASFFKLRGIAFHINSYNLPILRSGLLVLHLLQPFCLVTLKEIIIEEIVFH